MLKAIYRHLIKPFFTGLLGLLQLPVKFVFWIKKKAVGALNRYMFSHVSIDEENRFKCRNYKGFQIKKIALCNQIEWYLKQIKRDNWENKKRITIVFTCEFSAAWNSLSSTFQSAIDDPRIKVYILAIPEKKMVERKHNKGSRYSETEYEKNEAYEYCSTFFPDTINAYDEKNKSWFDLRTLKPDYVIILRSGQVHYPKDYTAKELCKYTKVCQIPYSYAKMIWDTKSIYNPDISDYVYAIFTENQYCCDMLQHIYHDLFEAKWKKIIYLGYTRSDLYKENIYDTNQGKNTTILWLPRWVTESRLEASTFFKYKDELIQFFLKHPEYKLICRPHPMMFDNFLVTGEMTFEQITDFKRLFSETDNLYLDEYSDYLPSFNKADIFVSDTSSLLVEEFMTGKPVIFCGISSHFDQEAKKWSRYFYNVQNKKELLDRLSSLLNGNDPGKEERELYLKKEMKLDGNVGKRIVQFFKDDFDSQQSAYAPLGY